jgi:hypothetical protein
MSKLTEDLPLLWNGQAGPQKPKRKGRRLLNLSKVNLDSNRKEQVFVLRPIAYLRTSQTEPWKNGVAKRVVFLPM